ncbi:MAG: hypothetical protein C0623_01765 [Desulfuromonas sp.]|nr:MAG: hypothetical protein C0623_01765 [Desulfuromonas sp.]
MNWQSVKNRFRPSISLKIILVITGMLVTLGSAAAVYVKTEFSEKLTNELLKRGVSVAKQLAENGSNAMVTEDRLALSRLAKASKDIEDDIVYSFFVTAADKHVLAHSFGEFFPIELLDTIPDLYSDAVNTRKLLTSGVVVYDITVPVISSQVGWVRLGISGNSVTMAVDNLIRQVLTVGSIILLTAIICSIPLARAISKPIRQLTGAVESITRGEQIREVRVSTKDEIGQLAAAFNEMTKSLTAAEESLAAQIRFLEDLLADIPEPVFYKAMDGKLLGCNHAFESFFEVNARELIGQSSYSYRPKHEAEIHVARDRDVLTENKKVSYEMRIERTNDTLRDVIFHKAPIRDERGEVNGLIGVVQDITEEREASRLKSEFVTTAAHEFQTPLASILGFSELILNNPEIVGDQLSELLQMIFSKASSLSHLVDEMLNLSRIESGHGIALNKSDCEINEELTKFIANFKLLYSDFNFQLNLPEETVVLSADKERMGQVIDNLLQNAVKYSEPGQTISITTRTSETHCNVSVEDHGIGMSAEQLAHATEKFYRGDTSDTAPRGTGLGLFIAKSIVEAHGGILEIESTPGKGTVVTFRIPFKQPETELHAPKKNIQISHIEH